MTTSQLPPEIPHGSVVITPTEMYTEMRAVRDEVRHLVAIVDPALTEVRTDLVEVKAQHEKDFLESKLHREKLDGRIRDLETRPVVTPRSMWAGATVLIAAFAALASVAIAIIQ